MLLRSGRPHVPSTRMLRARSPRAVSAKKGRLTGPLSSRTDQPFRSFERPSGDDANGRRLTQPRSAIGPHEVKAAPGSDSVRCPARGNDGRRFPSGAPTRLRKPNCQTYLGFNDLITRPNVPFDVERAAQVNRARKPNRSAIEGNAERIGIESVGDFLTRAQGR